MREPRSSLAYELEPRNDDHKVGQFENGVDINELQRSLLQRIVELISRLGLPAVIRSDPSIELPPVELTG